MGIYRTLLAISIYFIHAGWLGNLVIFPDRYKAVYSFFIISGFYMAYILNNKYIGVNSSYKLFIFNRFIRIYPIYWTILFLTIIFSLFMLIQGIDTKDISPFLYNYQTLLENNYLLFVQTFFKDIIHWITIIIHCGYFTRCDNAIGGFSTLSLSWTLNLEIMFYIIAPFILRKKGIGIIIVILSTYILWYIVFHFQLLSPYSTMYAFLHAMKLFMLGYISYLFYRRLLSLIKKLNPILLISICFIFLLIIFSYAMLPLPYLRFRWLIINDLIYYLIVAASLPFLFHFSNIFKFDQIIAKFSYPIYISHLFVLQVIYHSHLFNPKSQSYILIGLISTIIFSYLIIIFLENPLDKYRHSKLAKVNNK